MGQHWHLIIVMQPFMSYVCILYSTLSLLLILHIVICDYLVELNLKHLPSRVRWSSSRVRWSSSVFFKLMIIVFVMTCFVYTCLYFCKCCALLHYFACALNKNRTELYCWVELNWVEFNWIELNWIELNWIAWLFSLLLDIKLYHSIAV